MIYILCFIVALNINLLFLLLHWHLDEQKKEGKVNYWGTLFMNFIIVVIIAVIIYGIIQHFGLWDNSGSLPVGNSWNDIFGK